MATVNQDAKSIAIRKRHEFWTGKLNTAVEKDDADGVDTASAQITKIEAEAKEAGVDLNAPATTAAEAAPTVAAPATEGKVAKTKTKKEREAAVQERAAQLAANKAAAASNGGASKAPRTPKPKKEKELQPCLDGCGEMVPGNFKMGHDAKLKSMILKIERGDMEMSELPEIAQELVGFKKGEKEPIMSGGKQTGSRQLYVVTKAPVRFQGRPEITLTKRG